MSRTESAKNRAAEALPFVEGAATASPHDVSARINLAATLMALEENERARKVVIQARRDFPNAPRRAQQILADMQRIAPDLQGVEWSE